LPKHPKNAFRKKLKIIKMFAVEIRAMAQDTMKVIIRQKPIRPQ